MGRPRERTMTNDEFKSVKAVKYEYQEISNQLIFGVAEYKIYSMLSNAKQRTEKRPEYKDVKYMLGEYKNGLNNMRMYRPDLYDKFWDMIREFIDREFDQDFAPTIHRPDNGNYDWKTIDILPMKEHIQRDNAKMQGAMIFSETETSYNLIGLDLFSSKKELADRLEIDEKLIYKAKPGQVIKIDDIVIQFQDVIKGEPKIITKEEVMEKLNEYSRLIEKYDKAGKHEARDKFQEVYYMWHNTGVTHGFIEGQIIPMGRG